MSTAEERKYNEWEYEYSARIGKFMDICKRKLNISWSDEETARRLSVQITKCLPEDKRGGFREGNGNKDISTDKLEKFYKAKPPEDGVEDTYVKIRDYVTEKKTFRNKYKYRLETNDGTTVELDCHISRNQIKDYRRNKSIVPLAVLHAYCQLIGMSLDNFMSLVNNVDENKLKYIPTDILKSTHPINPEHDYSFGEIVLPFLRSAFFKNDRYIYDINKQNHLMTSLFPKNNTTTLYFYHLPLNNSLVDDNKNKIYFQRETLEFSRENGIYCQVTLKQDTSSLGIAEKQEYKGIAILVNPQDSGGICYCFLKPTRNDFARFTIVSFGLEPLGSSPNKIRIAHTLFIRRSDTKPYVSRVLLSEMEIEDDEMEIKDDEMKHLIVHTMLNTRYYKKESLHINILKEYIFTAKKYFNNPKKPYSGNDPLLKNCYELLEHYFGENPSNYNAIFEKINTKTTVEGEVVEGKVLKIDPNTLDNKDVAHQLVLAWLMRMGMSPNTWNDSISDEEESALNLIYETLRKKK